MNKDYKDFLMRMGSFDMDLVDEPDELYHYGVKGMKWGVRKYQNADGSLTKAGEARYDRDVRENNAKVKDKRAKIDGPDPSRWVKEDVVRTKKVVDSVSSLNSNTRDLVNAKRRMNKKNTLDLDSMSDKELKDAISRMNLERQYRDAVTSKNVSTGKDHLQSVFDLAGGVLAVTGSAVSIAVAIKELTG